MFIRELHVDGYGALQNLSCSLDAPVTVIYGPNEAGKSTLLRFIRSMLYGIPTRKDPVERGEPVFGGRHGGRMLVLAGGRQLALERYADGSGARKAAGGLVVRDEHGKELGWSQAEWERYVLGGVSERLFRQLFAVSLDELHELRTLQGEEIGNYLYHAGLAGGAALSNARRTLTGELDKLYRPRGTTQEINRILAAIKETEAAIRQSGSSVALFQETSSDLAATQRSLLDLEQSLPRLTHRAAELQGAIRVREWWLQRQLLLEEEQQLILRLPDPQAEPLGEESASQWAELLRGRQQAQERNQAAEQTVQERRSELSALQWDDTLLQHAAELERLDSMRAAMTARQEENEEVSADLRLLEDTIQSLSSRLSPDWGDEELASFGSVASERDWLRRLQQAHAEAERRRERLEADAARLQRQRESLLAEGGRQGAVEEASTQETGGRFRAVTRDALVQTWNALEDETRRFERTKASSEQPDGQTIESGHAATRTKTKRRPAGYPAAAFPLFAAAAVLALSALLLPIIGRSAAGHNGFLFTAAAILAGILAVLAVWAGLNRRSLPQSFQPSTNHEMQERLQQQEKRVQELLRDLLVKPETDAASLLQDEVWQRLRRQVQEELSRLERREQEQTRSQELQRRMAELDREKAALETEIQQAVQHSAEWQMEWEHWLVSRKLPSALTPDSVPDLLNMAEQAQTAMRSRARILERKAALDQMQAGFLQTAAALFERCPPPAAMQADPTLSVSWLYQRAGEQQAVKEEALRMERLLKQAEAEAVEASEALKKAEAQLSLVLLDVQAEDEQAYEQRLRIDARRGELSRERRELELRIEAGRSADSAAALYELLESHDEVMLTELFQQAEEARDSAEQQRNELLDRRGRLAQQLERQQREAETEDRQLRLAELESKLEQLTERYAVLAIADRLLQDTKAVFEEERQPEVLRIASRYFHGMSAGSYHRIIAPADAAGILAETEDHRVTDSGFLSRGTQEQLYLAMRFALAEAASGDFPLPLLLDDLFVHFDERRLHQTVPVLGEIARTRQVILFTCHRHVAKQMQDGLPSAQIMEWAGTGA